jgi:hypothetical protein
MLLGTLEYILEVSRFLYLTLDLALIFLSGYCSFLTNTKGPADGFFRMDDV